MTKAQMKASIRRVPGTHISEDRRAQLLDRIDAGNEIFAIHTHNPVQNTHTWYISIRGVERKLRALAS